MVKVFLDYGHGGTDPGASGSGLREKDMTLQIGRKVHDLLKGKVAVYESRNRDVTMSLRERTNKANKLGADVFVSIHINSFSTATANGVETFSYPKSANGAKLAKAIQDELVGTKLFKSNRGTKTANFHVLRESNMPAALTELGFIGNKHDADVMKNKQNELAQAIANGVLKYLGKGGGKPVKPKPSKPKPTPKPSKPKANLAVDGKWGKGTTRALQKALGTPVDGIISRQPRNSVSTSLYGGTVHFGSGGSMVIKALQKKIKVNNDGKLGPATARALQKYLGTVQDGRFSRPSLVIKEMQRRLNNGTF